MFAISVKALLIQLLLVLPTSSFDIFDPSYSFKEPTPYEPYFSRQTTPSPAPPSSPPPPSPPPPRQSPPPPPSIDPSLIPIVIGLLAPPIRPPIVIPPGFSGNPSINNPTPSSPSPPVKNSPPPPSQCKPSPPNLSAKQPPPPPANQPPPPPPPVKPPSPAPENQPPPPVKAPSPSPARQPTPPPVKAPSPSPARQPTPPPVKAPYLSPPPPPPPSKKSPPPAPPPSIANRPVMAPSPSPAAQPPLIILPPFPSPVAKPPLIPRQPVKPILPPSLPTPKTTTVNGLVYCKFCNSYGVPNLLNASLLQGASVRLVCYNGKKAIVQSATTDKNGDFRITPKSLSGADISKCKVYLLKSPNPICNVPTNFNGGKSGALLKQVVQPKPPIVVTPAVVVPVQPPISDFYDVGPFIFEASSKIPCAMHKRL